MKLKYYLRGLGLGVIITTILLAISFGVNRNNISDEEIISRAEKLGMEMKSRKVLSNEEILATEMEKQKKAREAENQAGTEAVLTTENPQDGESDGKGSGGADSEKKNSQESESEAKASEKDEPGKSSKTKEKSKDSETKDTEKTDSEEKNSEKSKADKAKTSETKNSEKKESESKESEQEGTLVTITVRDGDGCRQVAEQLQAKGLIQDSEEFRNYMSSRGVDSSIMNGTFQIPKGATYREISLIIVGR